MAKKKVESSQIDIVQVDKGAIDFCILGTTPLILNRMSQKVLHELILPKGRKTAAEKQGSIKHDPYAEFLASAYIDSDEKAPTLIQHLASAFKGGISGAALDVPGSSKAQIGRLVWVKGERLPVYGVPQMFMAVVRSADMNKTPDVRTRVIVPKWAMRITVEFTKPLLNEKSVTNLLVSAGITQGTGDWRPSKGKGTYGSFTIVPEDDAEYQQIIKTGGRKAQVKAMENPDCYDDETRELYDWFREEIVARGKHEQLQESPKSNGRMKKDAVEV